MHTGIFATPRLRAGLAMLGLAVLLPACAKHNSPGNTPCDTEGVNMVAFASNRTTSQYDIYLYDYDQVGFRLLKGLNSVVDADSSPALTSDGQTIAFVTQRSTTSTDILIYDRGSCSTGAIAAVNSAGDESQPNFSGDGQRLAFVRDTVGGHRIRMLNGNTFLLVPLPGLDAPGGFDDDAPASDRTATGIAFVSNRGGNSDVYVYDRNADSLVTLPGLNSAASDIEPTLSPDAHFLCFASNRAGGTGGFDLYLYDLVTKTLLAPPTNLNSTGDDRRPCLSADGNTIAFQSDRGHPGTMDVLLYQRITTTLVTRSGLAGPLDDVHPSLRFP
jgi:Tol biopolymer transport system component